MSSRPTFFLLIFSSLIAAQLSAQEAVQFITSPFRSQEMTARLLDAADVRILLPFGYESDSDTTAGIKLNGRKGTKGTGSVR